MNELMSISITDNTVMFTSFPDSLRGKGLLFTTTKGSAVRSSCFPVTDHADIWVCGENKKRDREALTFSTVEMVEDFVNGLVRFCSGRGIKFSFDGKIVLGGL